MLSEKQIAIMKEMIQVEQNEAARLKDLLQNDNSRRLFNSAHSNAAILKKALSRLTNEA